MKRVTVKLLLISVLVFAGVKIWYGRLEERLQVPAAATQDTAATQAVARTEIARQPNDFTIIVDRNIFQAVITKVETEVAESVQEVAPTKLQLSLMGTISGTERAARAIIADDKKKQQDIYQVGDSVQGALIKNIERGRVVLQVNGADEELLLKDREGGGPAYEPPASEFVQEPEPPAEVLPEPEVVEPVEQPAPEAPAQIIPEVPVQATPEVPEQTMPEETMPNQPVVRPRPHRRPLRAPDAGTIQQPGASLMMNNETEHS